MTRGQFIGMIMTAILLTSIASSAYLLSHRYQTAASQNFLYVINSFTGEILTYTVTAGEARSLEHLSLQEIGRR